MGVLAQPLIAVIAMAMLGLPGLLVLVLGWRNIWLIILGLLLIAAAAYIGYNAFFGDGYVMSPGVTPQRR